MGIVVIGAVFVDIKGYPLSTYIPGGRNAGRMEQVHGGVSQKAVDKTAALCYNKQVNAGLAHPVERLLPKQ